MTAHAEKYEKLVNWSRVTGVLVLLSGALLFLLNEDDRPTFYLAAFVVLQISILGLIGLTVLTARFKKKHGIHRHG